MTLTREELVQKVSERLHRAMKEARVSKADKKYRDLTATNLDAMVVDLLLEGSLTVDRVQAELERLRGLLVERTQTPETIKNGIVAFDELAQYLAHTSDEVSYPTDRNRARDLLTVYASALHR